MENEPKIVIFLYHIDKRNCFQFFIKKKNIVLATQISWKTKIYNEDEQSNMLHFVSHLF